MSKATYLGHACVLFENDDVTLLQDPWLGTPAYFNSWFHFPRSVPIEKIPKPTHIYVSHAHQDHLNKESLSKFDKDTQIIIANVEPEFKGQPPVKDQIASLGFKKIVELANFETYSVGNTTLTMLVNQYDSGLCIQDKNVIVLNTNDCIIEPLMGRIKAKFTPIDLAFMLPIAASAYPQCYSLEDLNESKNTAHLRDIARFIQRTLYLQPKAVVPFACMYAHFKKDLQYLNGGSNPYDSLELMKQFIYPQNKLGPKIKPILMAPGDYWTNKAGYKKVNKFNWKNINSEYKKAQKQVQKILDERVYNGTELTYTSTSDTPVKIEKIQAGQHDSFEKEFASFMKRLFKITQKEKFNVLFDFGWYKPVVDFKDEKIDTTKPWDVSFQITPELFKFFMENPAEWGNIMLSYRIKIKIKKGFRYNEYKLQQAFHNAYTV